MEVTNIKIVENTIKYKDTIFESLLEDNKHLFPVNNHKTISFELLNSNTELANAIRRVITNELEVKLLQVNINDIKTDDKYILSDIIKDRIESIPINQNIPDDYIFKLSITNNTLDIHDVNSSDLLLMNYKKNTNELFNQNMKICYLNSNKYITINDIHVNKNTGFYNGKYSLCTVNYEIINTDFKIASLNNDNTDFKMSIKTNGNIEPIEIIKSVVLNLEKRLKIIESYIIEYNKIYNSSDIQLVDTNNVYIIKNYDLFSYYINNESHTIGNLLVKYIYNIDNNIELINYSIPHPSKHQVIINIKHTEHNSIILKSIKNIIKDLHVFQSYFV